MGLREVYFVLAVFLVAAAVSFSSVGADIDENARPARDVSSVKIAIADTDAKSDSKAAHGMASSSSSTKGSAAFVSKYPHHEKHRRSARDVEAAVADTDAKSDSKAGHGMAASSSSTKGSATFTSKHGDKHRISSRSVEGVKIALADTEAESDSKAKDGMAVSSSSTKGNAAFVSKNHHRRSAKAMEKEDIAVANTNGHSDSAAGFTNGESDKNLHEEAKPFYEEEYPAHKTGKSEKVDHHLQEEGHKEENEQPKKPFLDIEELKKKIAKFATVSVNL